MPDVEPAECASTCGTSACQRIVRTVAVLIWSVTATLERPSAPTAGRSSSPPPTLRLRVSSPNEIERANEPSTIMSPTRDLGSVITDYKDAGGRPIKDQFKFSRLSRMQNSERYLMSGRFEENYRFEDSGFDDAGGCGCEKHSAVREAHLREGRPVREHEECNPSGQRHRGSRWCHRADDGTTPPARLVEVYGEQKRAS